MNIFLEIWPFLQFKSFFPIHKNKEVNHISNSNLFIQQYLCALSALCTGLVEKLMNYFSSDCPVILRLILEVCDKTYTQHGNQLSGGLGASIHTPSPPEKSNH